jgi:hypothetical protein
MFYVGQKVVCVNDRASHGFPQNDMGGLTAGQIYTVSKVGVRSWLDGAPCIFVAEIFRGDSERGFWEHRFRPVVDRKTDISIFTKILNDVNKRELVPVDR